MEATIASIKFLFSESMRYPFLKSERVVQGHKGEFSQNARDGSVQCVEHSSKALSLSRAFRELLLYKASMRGRNGILH